MDVLLKFSTAMVTLLSDWQTKLFKELTKSNLNPKDTQEYLRARRTPRTKVQGFCVQPLSFKWHVATKPAKIVGYQRCQFQRDFDFFGPFKRWLLRTKPLKSYFLTQPLDEKTVQRSLRNCENWKIQFENVFGISHKPVKLQRPTLPF